MFGDMLFGNTHNVEQLVDIKKKKKVDKVLLKVIKTIRSRTGISDWIKPESDLKKDFNISDKAISSICDILNEYYQVNIEPQYTGSVKDIVQFIKCHQQTAADSIFLIDSSTLDIDENNDTTESPDNVEPRENLEVDPEIVKASQPSNTVEEKVPEGVDASTEKDKTDDEQADLKSEKIEYKKFEPEKIEYKKFEPEKIEYKKVKYEKTGNAEDKNSSQESYSMENLQVNKEEDNDWGNMLNSF